MEPDVPGDPIQTAGAGGAAGSRRRRRGFLSPDIGARKETTTGPRRPAGRGARACMAGSGSDSHAVRVRQLAPRALDLPIETYTVYAVHSSCTHGSMIITPSTER
jgi:hypothetical protein